MPPVPPDITKKDGVPVLESDSSVNGSVIAVPVRMLCPEYVLSGCIGRSKTDDPGLPASERELAARWSAIADLRCYAELRSRAAGTAELSCVHRCGLRRLLFLTLLALRLLQTVSTSIALFLDEMADFPALPGLYQLLFLHIEPVSTMLTAALIWFSPGAAWFHGELIPGIETTSPLDERSTMAVWQLGNCA